MKRIGTFQGLRGAAILIIMLSHFVDAVHFLGHIGNSIFFVLSGFLAMYTYRPRKETLWKEMAFRYWRKFKKTYGTFLVATVLAIPLGLHILHDSMMIPKVIVYLLQLQAWVLDYSGYGWIILVGPSWFLGAYLFCECLVPILAPLVREIGGGSAFRVGCNLRSEFGVDCSQYELRVAGLELFSAGTSV